MCDKISPFFSFLKYFIIVSFCKQMNNDECDHIICLLWLWLCSGEWLSVCNVASHQSGGSNLCNNECNIPCSHVIMTNCDSDVCSADTGCYWGNHCSYIFNIKDYLQVQHASYGHPPPTHKLSLAYPLGYLSCRYKLGLVMISHPARLHYYFQ